MNYIKFSLTRLKKHNMIAIQHIPREYNAVAHALAKIVLASNDDCIWKEFFPPQIMVKISLLS